MPPSTTVQKIGSKRVNIKTQGQQNCRATVILIIFESGEKLAPLIILKLKRESEQKMIARKRKCEEQKNIYL